MANGENDHATGGSDAAGMRAAAAALRRFAARDLRLALWFASGTRPARAAIEACAGGPGAVVPFRVSPDAQGDPSRLELVAGGWSFTLTGAAPAPSARVDAPLHPLGVAPGLDDLADAIAVTPATENPAGAPLGALIRPLVGLGCALAGLTGLRAIGWQPAGTAMAPEYFRRIGTAWLAGGAFPGLGLVALAREGDALCSTGLRLFTGYEIAIDLGGDTAAAAKRAIRIMDLLVERGCTPAALGAGLGEPHLIWAFSPDARWLRIGTT